MRKSAKLVSLLLCVVSFFSFPITSYAADDNITFSPSYLMLNVGGSGNGVTDPVFDGSLQLLPPEFGVTSNQITSIQFGFTLSSNFNAGDQITTFATSTLGGVAFTEGYYYVYEEGSPSYTKLNVLSGDGIAVDYTVKTNCNSILFNFYSTAIKHSGDTTTASTRLKVTYNFSSADIGLLNSIIEYIKGIFSDLQDLPNKIGDFFTNLINNLKSFFDNIGSWISELGTNIKSWFSDLGDRISDFFTNLGDNISGFFEKLWNRIYWGNENGEAEYQPPVFGSSLDDVLDTLDGYITQLDDTNEQIENATNTSVAYVEQGTTVINSVFGVFPSIVTALVIFGVVFIFCRKVVGR